jgi:hypothetical protein
VRAAVDPALVRCDPRRTSAIRDLPPWLCGLALAAPLAIAYLIAAPPSGDLAAATYRSDLFARAGFTVWDNGWYAGHALPAYSLLAPALGSWTGVRTLLALSAVGAAALFGLLAQKALPSRSARAVTLAFAFGFCAELPSGRVPYDLGAAIGLAALLTLSVSSKRCVRSQLERHRPRTEPGTTLGHAERIAGLIAAIALSIATSAASPVAGAFLALAGLSVALSSRARAPQAAAVCLAALGTILLLALAFPEGGSEPFAASAFWPELAAAVAFAALLPRGGFSVTGSRTLRIGACLYILALIGCFAISSPVGGNVVRLGAMFGAPLVLGALWEAPPVSIGGRRIAARMLVLALCPLLLYWQLATAIDDQVALAGDPTVDASFYSPLRAELLKLAAGKPIRVEIPLTGAHWESAYLPGGPISIARGWERQLDTRYGALFYRRGLTAAAYRRWLQENAVAYVALPDARLDSAGQQEARLITGSHPPLPYLREAWRSQRWRLFAVQHAKPLAQPPAKMLSIGVDSFALTAPRSGVYRVRLHWTPYWALRAGRGCVSKAPSGFTEVYAPIAETLRVVATFSLSQLLSEGPVCAH